MIETIAIVGAGAWGTALSHLLSTKGHQVHLWAYEPEVAQEISRQHRNSPYLPDIDLSPRITATNDLAETVRGAAYVVLVCPSHIIRTMTAKIAPAISPSAIIVNASKGIEADTGKLISEILAETLPQHAPHRIAYLSGPSFAREVAQGHPTAVVIAGVDGGVAAAVQTLFRTDFFMTFCHDDIIGVQVGGAVKNVLAIAAGIVDGLQLGYNTRAALLTRGLYEIMKLTRALGGNPLTLVGLAGIGDLILTCTGDLSRNRGLGIALGQGRSAADITAGARTVAEGIVTTKAVYQLIRRHAITAPICTAMYQILYEGKAPHRAVQELTAMELGEELGTLLHPEGVDKKRQ